MVPQKSQGRTRIDTPGRYEPEKGRRCVCGQRDKTFVSPCRLRGTALRCTEGGGRQEDPGRWLSKGKKQDGWVEVVPGPRGGNAWVGSCGRRIPSQLGGVRGRNRTRWAVKVLLACKRRALEGRYGGRSSSRNRPATGFKNHVLTGRAGACSFAGYTSALGRCYSPRPYLA